MPQPAYKAERIPKSERLPKSNPPIVVQRENVEENYISNNRRSRSERQIIQEGHITKEGLGNIIKINYIQLKDRKRSCSKFVK
jgi:isocitrate/isopropylmalate dehydrogenase